MRIAHCETKDKGFFFRQVAVNEKKIVSCQTKKKIEKKKKAIGHGRKHSGEDGEDQ